MRIRYYLILAGLIPGFYITAQQTDYQWWNERHGWDGISPFERYLVLESGKTGPNALPVPESIFYHWDSLHYFTNTLQYHHYDRGEHTASLRSGIFCHIDRSVTLKTWIVAAEYFSSNELVRDFRAARTLEGRGWSTGDLYVETHWHILRHRKKLPDLAMRIGLKTASGSRVEDVRFTDTPGYYFDLNFRKLYTYFPWQIQWYGMTGFYAYQTYRTDYKQNDAFLFGAGIRAQKQKWGVDVHARSYYGYFSEYDKPLVLSVNAFLMITHHIIHLRIERGNLSWPFLGLYCGYTIRY